MTTQDTLAEEGEGKDLVAESFAIYNGNDVAHWSNRCSFTPSSLAFACSQKQNTKNCLFLCSMNSLFCSHLIGILYK